MKKGKTVPEIVPQEDQDQQNKGRNEDLEADEADGAAGKEKIEKREIQTAIQGGQRKDSTQQQQKQR